MTKVLVKVNWIHPDQGGRTSLPKGDHYVTVIKFPHQSKEDWSQNAWSIRIDWLDKDISSQWYGLAYFPAANSPDRWLVPGETFELLEGPKSIGKVDVVTTAKAIENIMKVAA